MNETDIARVQAYLRATLGNDRIHIDVPKRKGGTVEVRVGDEFIGTVHRDEDEGEVSFSLTISILDEDLPSVALPRAIGAQNGRKAGSGHRGAAAPAVHGAGAGRARISMRGQRMCGCAEFAGIVRLNNI